MGSSKVSEYGKDPRQRFQGRPDLKNTNPDGVYSGMTKRAALEDGSFTPEMSKSKRAKTSK